MSEAVTKPELNLVYHPDGRVVNETNNDPAVPRVTGFSRYWLAADLGQANDYSAVVVLKDEALPIIDNGKCIVGPRERTVVYADRFRGVSYVDVVDHLIRLKNAPPFAGKTALCIDGTSIGRVVSDMLWEQNVNHHAIQMTGGQDWSRKGRYVNAGKTLMIETTAVLFASGDIKFAQDLPLRQEIEDDLGSFTTATTAAGNQVITQSRSSAGHGDLGIALIVGAFASHYLHRQHIVVSSLKGWH
ncbi:hypothetical protein Dshi_1916 [Dinoroseobacter shibae DFL 12 = DSM 16493]|jgi:hypothetical protein|uniref:Uncharacterized protein n=1 Tax=Dinoroseobacter shibae (strain DSM 16493 / NCIMB 14021 / DFL 12) TaxID=398580 RepID=A8LNE5_DINSH|nr:MULTISPECIES: hypothetical protein [Dinoroseobacter]ABV93658.1 hypothetical protein Dshi_1916 [Dinoroseobacter shibae DFL 12 = DSM 16493]MDD9715245.1 hypothetical protein [Dinoroseobacter sp. PD6]URF45110.1 hypothetical protein M8008_09920 [Dinoroseobacter shibae]URF49415.1 hypothetical protein M8007_09920 [Dinoroseobacter shibae]